MAALYNISTKDRLLTARHISSPGWELYPHIHHTHLAGQAQKKAGDTDVLLSSMAACISYTFRYPHPIKRIQLPCIRRTNHHIEACIHGSWLRECTRLYQMARSWSGHGYTLPERCAYDRYVLTRSSGRAHRQASEFSFDSTDAAVHAAG